MYPNGLTKLEGIFTPLLVPLDDRGQIDLGKANPLAYGGHAYWTLGQFVERQGYTASH